MSSIESLKFCLHCGTPSSEAYCCNACKILDANWGPVPVLEKNQNPYSYLDQPEFRDLYVHLKNSSEERFVIFAEGLHCTSCVHLLEKLPSYMPEVISARVNFSQSSVVVHLKPGASLAQVAHVIEELGYRPSFISPQEDLSSKFQVENRTIVKRIAVAGFCAGNTMLFVIPVYAGLSGTWAHVFNFLSFLLFLPILFYSAVPFYKGAWTAVKYQTVNVDLPITLAMLLGFTLSTFNLVRGEGDIYYDSTASFMFFILSARFLLKRVQQNYLAPLKIRSFFKEQKFLKKNKSAWDTVPAHSLGKEDVLKITRGQTIPAEAELLSSFANVDMSLFNGESMPRVFSQGMKVFAGTQVLDRDIEVRLLGSFSESRLGSLLKELEEGALVKSPFIALTDRLAQQLILVVFALAVVFFIFYAAIDIQEAFNRSLALIVLACPCALAFGSPLTYGLALKKAQKKGVLLKDASSLEKILQLKHVLFDKTGTLTEGQLKLAYSEPAVVCADLQKIILSLEAPSYHPVAFAIRNAWQHPQELYPIVSEEILGRGVRGTWQGSFYEIRHLSDSVHESELAIEVIKDGKGQCRLYFTDALRPEAKAVIQTLHQKNIQTHLLSGDKKSRVFEVAEKCGIPASQVSAELFPEDKKAYVEKFKNTCMIGDGANDSLSLQAADVGIAVKGSVDLSLHSADIYFTRGGLSPFLDLLKLSKQTQNVLLRNLSISLMYNLIGGVLALMGFINPMMAAILMPISSALIVLSSLWGFR